jgi:hypothetical protein
MVINFIKGKVFILNKKIIPIFVKNNFTMLPKRKRGRPKMAAKDRRIPITIMVPAAKAKELRILFLKLSKES